MVIWITGLAGSGKTTIAREVYEIIKKQYKNCVFLDGDDFREIMGGFIGYSNEDRLKGALIFHNLCKFLDSQNIIVVCSVMVLFKKIQKMNRKTFNEYIEIFLNVEFDELLKRDKKSLYSRALKGEVKDVVGVDLPYDEPENPELFLDNNTIEQKKDNISLILNYLNKNFKMELKF